jgi:hypothetical protein
MEDLIERNLMRKSADSQLTSILRGGGGTDDVVRAGLTNPAPQMLRDFREARQLIAKTYSVEKALNPTTGNIDALKLASELKKGKPLSGGLKDIADFAAQFPKASQRIEGMGSLPQTSPLDWGLGAVTSAATSSPLGLLTVGARPAARSLVLSKPVQDRLLQKQTQQGLLGAMLSSDEAALFGYRAAPLLALDQ